MMCANRYAKHIFFTHSKQENMLTTQMVNYCKGLSFWDFLVLRSIKMNTRTTALEEAVFLVMRLKINLIPWSLFFVSCIPDRCRYVVNELVQVFSCAFMDELGTLRGRGKLESLSTTPLGP